MSENFVFTSPAFGYQKEVNSVTCRYFQKSPDINVKFRLGIWSSEQFFWSGSFRSARVLR